VTTSAMQKAAGALAELSRARRESEACERAGIRHPRDLLNAYADLREDLAEHAFAALRAVLAIHPLNALDDAFVCGRCHDFTGEPERWPCRTVDVIAQELERQ
jgi:hypothetical protein